MLECMRSQYKHCGVFNLPVSYINYLAARKFVGSSALAPLRKIGQVAGAAGSRDQHKPLMLLHLDLEPKKTALFLNLPVESARAAKNGVILDSTATAIVQFSSVLPRRFHPQIFSVDTAS
jgi:uncharacterized protein YigA (DUF484 family)